MRNPDTMDIDRCSALEIVEKINCNSRLSEANRSGLGTH